MSLKRTISLVFGVVFLLVGILGFFYNPILSVIGLNLFETDTLHNLVHLLSGIAGIALSTSDKYSDWYLKGFGSIYALVAVLGLVWPNDLVLGIIHIDFSDDILHVVLALGLLAAGFGLQSGMMIKKEAKAM